MPETKPLFNSLKIQELALAVHLGCSAEERARTQEVRVSVELRFAEAPRGVLTDQLDDTVCYAQIAEAIRSHLEARSYQLVEKMAYDAYECVRKVCGPGVMIGLTLCKVNPPVANLRGGTVYCCGDFAS